MYHRTFVGRRYSSLVPRCQLADKSHNRVKHAHVGPIVNLFADLGSDFRVQCSPFSPILCATGIVVNGAYVLSCN